MTCPHYPDCECWANPPSAAKCQGYDRAHPKPDMTEALRVESERLRKENVRLRKVLQRFTHAWRDGPHATALAYDVACAALTGETP